MEKIDNSYPYEELDDPKGEIRILELLPGERSAAVVGKLFRHKLSDQLEYDALSYTWGDPTITAAIQLDGDENFRIPAKLVVALQDLRLPSESRIIWVDAICINQRNTNERNHQVQVMRRIYEQATTVRTWIDHEIDPGSPPFVKLYTITAESTVADIGDDPNFWRPVSDIGEQRYWTRLWIQQEVAYAKKLTIHCRENKISVVSLANYHRLVREKAFTEVALIYTEWLKLQNHFMQLPTAYQPMNPQTKEPGKTRKFKNIIFALHQSRYLGSLDPKDRVFGLLGLIEDYDEGDVPIDYDLSVKKTYCNVIDYVLCRYQSLGFLLTTSLGDSNPNNELPSWIADWSQTSLGQVRVTAEELVSSDATRVIATNVPEILHDQFQLRITGFRIDEVQRVFGDMIWKKDTVATGWLQAWTAVLQDMQEMHTSAAKYGEPQQEQPGQTGDSESFHFEHLVRTMLTAQTEDDKTVAKEHSPFLNFMYKLVLSELEKDNPWEGSESIFEHDLWKLWVRLTDMMIVATLGRALFLSRKGRLGLAPMSAISEDEIWIVFRCSKPLILRPTGGNYVVVGPAHLDGHAIEEDMENMPSRVTAGEQYGSYLIQDIILQ